MNSKDIDTSKLKLHYFSQHHRGLLAAKDIKKDETVLFIPKEQILTFKNLASQIPLKNKKKKYLRFLNFKR